MAIEVVLVRTSSLGDVVHTLPVAETLKRAFPSVRLAWVVERSFREILEGNPYIDELIEVDFRSWKRRPVRREAIGGLLRSLRRLRRRRRHIAVDLQGLVRSGLIAYASGAPVRVGIEEGAVREKLNCIFTNVKGPCADKGAHIVDQNLSLLSVFGVERFHRSFHISIPERVAAGVESFLSAPEGACRPLRIALNPAAGWQTKTWAPERYAALADRIAGQLRARVYLLWGPGERGLAERVRSLMREDAAILPPMGLKSLAALIARSDAFIGGDSGPLHLASALGVPVVGIYGPSDPSRNGPFAGRSRVVRYTGECAGCYKRRCASRECMDRVSVEEVWCALVALLEEAYLDGSRTVVPPQQRGEGRAVLPVHGPYAS
jgi:lipopolysaccharide heptosyltransferase I